jgi:hypothetical protein
MQKKWIVFTVAVALLGNAFGARAQEQQQQRKVIIAPPVEQALVIAQGQVAPPPPEGEMRGDNLIFVATEMSFGGKVVKGAPYSAQAVTETVQALADGNRIVQKNTAQVYRDSEGRIRRDQELGSIGPYAAAGEPQQLFFINDPVAGVSYTLDPRTKTANKMLRMEFHYKIESDAAAGHQAPPAPGGVRKESIERSFVFQRTPGGPDAPPGVMEGSSEFRFAGRSSKAETKTEKLDARSFDGVQAEGTRTTTTIPAGELGNEQPINIVSERWYSPELQVVLLTRHNDPRFGETTYRLTNITRSEPAATLFQVPSDYTVKERGVPGAPGVRRMRRPVPPPEN